MRICAVKLLPDAPTYSSIYAESPPWMRICAVKLLPDKRAMALAASMENGVASTTTSAIGSEVATMKTRVVSTVTTPLKS